MTSMAMTRTAEARDEEAALESLHKAGMTDGLPVVIPTRQRVEDMIISSGMEGDVVLGIMGPGQGAATIEAVAANAVMAGCLPEHFPVVVAAIRAVADPLFDLTEVQVTTHPVTPLIMVNGPARHQCGLNWGTGSFGPGFRANASIGRAVRLAMMNIGGGRAGVCDMAVYGTPAKFTFCGAENEEESPFPPLHVSRGFKPEQSAVTVVPTEGPHSVVCVPVPEELREREADIWVSLIGAAIGNLGSNTTYVERGNIMVILNPLLANVFAGKGYTREKLAERFTAGSRHKRGYLRSFNPGFLPPGREDEIVERDPATILIAVSGGGGHYCMVCPTIGVSPHNSTAVSKEIMLDTYCALPPRAP